MARVGSIATPMQQSVWTNNDQSGVDAAPRMRLAWRLRVHRVIHWQGLAPTSSNAQQSPRVLRVAGAPDTGYETPCIYRGISRAFFPRRHDVDARPRETPPRTPADGATCRTARTTFCFCGASQWKLLILIAHGVLRPFANIESTPVR